MSDKVISVKEKIESAAKGQLVEVISREDEQTSTRLYAFQVYLQKFGGALLDALPKHMTRERCVSLFLKTLRDEPKLLNCTLESILMSLSEAATLGLEIDGVLGHAYLIPYKREAKLVPGYRGLIDLSRRYDRIQIATNVVYPEDEFAYQLGDTPRIHHIPDQTGRSDTSDARITHVYLVAKDATGDVICRSVWSRGKIERHKEQYSPAWEKRDSPWNTKWSTMARKTLIRDSIARGEIPVSSEVQRLAVQEERIEFDASAPTSRHVLPMTVSKLVTNTGGLDDDSGAENHLDADRGKDDAGKGRGVGKVSSQSFHELMSQGEGEEGPKYAKRLITMLRSGVDCPEEDVRWAESLVNDKWEAGDLVRDDVNILLPLLRGQV